MIEGMNLIMIYFKNFCKGHNVPEYSNNMIIKNAEKKKIRFEV
jgi:hypothetical protein